MRFRLVGFLVGMTILVASGSSAWAQEPAFEANPKGIVGRLYDGPRSLATTINVSLFMPGWQRSINQYDLADVKTTRSNRTVVTTGTWNIDDAQIEFHQAMRTTDQGVTDISYLIKAGDAPIELAGVFLLANVAIDAFAGGNTMTAPAGAQARLPEKLGEKELLPTGWFDRISFKSISGSSLELELRPARPAMVQDCRAFGAEEYGAFITLHEGSLRAGQSVQRSFRFRPSLVRDNTPAAISVDFDQEIHSFEGFGGNFVYGSDSPQVEKLLQTLPSTWARGEIILNEWEPVNDNDDALVTDAKSLAARDVPGSVLRRRFELDQRLFKESGGNYILSNWRLAEWMYAEPTDGWRTHAGTVPEDRWDEVDESIVSYLQHLKKNYNVEPIAFSFNESDLGVNTRLTGKEFRALALRLGPRMEAAGLQTKLLLGDSASLEDGLVQMQPTVNDTEAMKHIAAVAYHPWAGEHEHWQAWAELAKTHDLPLILTEVGADAAAWQNQAMHTLVYAVADLRRYMELLRDSQADALLTWEWTSDYGLLLEDAGQLKPTSRYWFVWQLANLTPRESMAVTTSSDREDVIAVAYVKGDAYVIHLGNLVDDRDATVAINALPVGLKSLKMVAFPLDESEPIVSEISVNGNEVCVRLPARSLVTLTSGEIPNRPSFEP